MAYDVFKVANTLLKMGDEIGEPLSNMKLQKILYYEQGYHLAYFDTPLFNEDIHAWFYGSVVPCVYERYKEYKNGLISYDEVDGEIEFKNKREWIVFRNVFDALVAYSAIGLMRMTHSETPWMQADAKGNGVITISSLKSYFKDKVKNG